MKALTTMQSVWVMVGSVAAFHVAHEWEGAGGLILIYVAGMYLLARMRSVRFAFWSGLLLGLALVVPQLWFFFGIFGAAAVPLWFILAFWIALFLVLATMAMHRWPRWGILLIPVLWTGCEYFRSELYALRFSWLSPGLTLSHPAWSPALEWGQYGLPLAVMGIAAITEVAWRHGRKVGFAALGGMGLVAVIAGLSHEAPGTHDGPRVVGIQLEFPLEHQVLQGLNQALKACPDAELLVLGEYTFQGPLPAEIRAWCREHRRYLIAGGMEPLADDGFYNMAYVVDPSGDIVFMQAKSVPIQFFNDGTPAEQQGVWDSPWGRIGIGICYDMSYTRVLDELIRQGAQALIIPTLDAEEWGRRQHLLHAKVAPVRAREYRIGILRVATSGISQLVQPDGRVMATAPFGAQNARLSGRLAMVEEGRLPVDRWLAPLCVAGSVAIIFGLMAPTLLRLARCRRFRRRPADRAAR